MARKNGLPGANIKNLIDNFMESRRQIDTASIVRSDSESIPSSECAFFVASFFWEKGNKNTTRSYCWIGI